MKNIQTANLVIDPELCKRLDQALYSDNAPESVINRFNLYHAELFDLLASYDPELAYKKSGSLYRMCSWINRIQSDKGL